MMRWIYRAALRAHERDLRQRFGDEMLSIFTRRYVDVRASRGIHRAWLFGLTEIINVVATGYRTPAFVNQSSSRERSARMGSNLGNDLFYALRRIRHQPGFSAATVVTLALAIGANTAVFSIVKAVLLSPLPYPDSDRIVGIFSVSERGGALGAVSPLDWHDYSRTGLFDSLAAMMRSEMTFTDGGEPETLRGFYVTNEFFSVLRTPPALGRAFREEDANSNGETLSVILGHGLWQRRFAGDPGVIGRAVRLDGKPRVVVGVMPSGFQYPSDASYWLPLRFSPEDLRPNQRGAVYLSAVARLKPGITIKQADEQIVTLAARLAREYPRSNEGRGGAVRGLHAVMVRDVRTALLALLGAVLCVLLIACANIGNLFLARAAGRQAEVAVRTSLGATRGRLTQQFVVEGLTLAVMGGAAGVGMATWTLPALRAAAPVQLPLVASAHLDGRVLIFSAIVTAIAGLLFGLTPAVRLVSNDGRVLRDRGTTLSRGQRKLQHALVVGELATAIVLLVGAGLLARSFVRLTTLDPGFDPAGVMTFRVSLPEARYGSAEAILEFYDRVQSQITSLPGVEHAALVFGLPLGDFRLSSTFTIPERPDARPEPGGRLTIISGGYFRALRIPLRSGRTFDSRDTFSAPGVAIVNETAARRFWPGENPVGRSLRLHLSVADWPGSPVRHIIGVVGDVRQSALSLAGAPEIYIPYAQQPIDAATFVVRSRGNPTSFVAAARARVKLIDPELPLAEPLPLAQLVRDSVADRRFNLIVLTVFAGAALLLAVVGVYGMMSYVVAQRAREMGVRLALGAEGRDVLFLVIGQAVRLAALGTVIGIIGALLLARTLRSLLFEVDPADPLTLIVVVLTLGSAVLLASYVPARRATLVDPMTTLRAE